MPKRHAGPFEALPPNINELPNLPTENGITLTPGWYRDTEKNQLVYIEPEPPRPNRKQRRSHRPRLEEADDEGKPTKKSQKRVRKRSGASKRQNRGKR